MKPGFRYLPQLVSLLLVTSLDSLSGSETFARGVRGGNNPKVHAMAWSGANLYVAGRFELAGSVTVHNIAKWDGQTWSDVGGGVIGGPDGYGEIYALLVVGNQLYVGGRFTAAGNTSAKNIARWNGTTWSALGAGIWSPLGPDQSTVRALASLGSSVVAGGGFSRAGSIAVNNVARWTGSTWVTMGNGLGTGGAGNNSGVLALLGLGGNVLAGGNWFVNGPGQNGPRNIAYWQNGAWVQFRGGGPFPAEVDGTVYALHAGPSGRIWVGGHFSYLPFASPGNENVAVIDNEHWTRVPGANTLNSTVYAFATGAGDEVYMAGHFEQGFCGSCPTGFQAKEIAKWDNTLQQIMPIDVSNVSTPSGCGLLMFDGVQALAYSQAGVYIGGQAPTGTGFNSDGTEYTCFENIALGVRPNAGSLAVKWRAIGNELPSISIASPAHGTAFERPSSIPFTVSTADDCAIDHVEYFANGLSIGVSATPPFSFSWNNPIPNTYTITAVATDSDGAQTTSTAISITVVDMQLANGHFDGVGRFWFDLSGAPSDGNCSFEASQDLAEWVVLASGQIIGTGGPFADDAAPSFPYRFYRVRCGAFFTQYILGYTRLTIPGKNASGGGGFAMIANQLDAPPNTLASLMPSVPSGTKLYKWNESAGGYDPVHTFTTGPGWTQNGSPSGNTTLAPGEGAFLSNPGTTPMTVTFIGNVLPGAVNNSIPTVGCVRSFKVPQAGTLNAMGFPAADGDTITTYDKITQGYNFSYYLDGVGWDPAVPTLEVGQSFQISPAGLARTWAHRIRMCKLRAGAFAGNSFQIQIDGPPNAVCSIQKSSDLTTWTDAGSVTLNGTTAGFTDTSASGQDYRFYRVNDGRLASINSLGYSRLTIPGKAANGSGGWAMIANQLDAAPNTLASLLPSVPSGTQLYKWNESAGAYYPVHTFTTGQGWTQSGSPSGSTTLAPGEGAMVANPGTTPITVTFIGTVLQGTVNNSIPGTSCLRSFKIPQAGNLDALGFPAVDGDTCNVYDKNAQAYIANNYIDGVGWDPAVPTLGIGQAFLLYGSQARTWTKYFEVWP